jgi:hypothetical protein
MSEVPLYINIIYTTTYKQSENIFVARCVGWPCRVRSVQGYLAHEKDPTT